MNSDEGVDYQRVVHRAAPIDQNLDCVLTCEPRTVRAIGRQRIIAINDGENTGSDRNVGSFKTCWVASAIPIFVMMPDDWNDWVRKVDGRENISSDACV